MTFQWDDAPGAGVLHVPDGEVRGGLVTLHGASDGRARQPLFDRIARLLAPVGVAVLAYPRRTVDDGDTPLAAQAADAVAAVRALRTDLGCPVGIFGFSQGAWAAALAAADEAVDLLIVLGCSGVSPAQQMRFHTDELLRRHGFGESERRRMGAVRVEVEDHLRAATHAAGRRDQLAGLLRDASREPWFRLAHLPPEPPPDDARWADMDFDPVPSFREVRVPVLAMWGADEECVPRQPSRDAWRASGADVTLVDLPGCGHWPVPGSGDPGYAGWEEDDLSPDFAVALTGWLDRELAA